MGKKRYPALATVCSACTVSAVVIAQASYIFVSSVISHDEHFQLESFADFGAKCDNFELHPDFCSRYDQKLKHFCHVAELPPDSSKCTTLLNMRIRSTTLKDARNIKRELHETVSWILPAWSFSVICFGPSCACFGALVDNVHVAPVMTTVFILASLGGFVAQTTRTFEFASANSRIIHGSRAIAWFVCTVSGLWLLSVQFREFRCGAKLPDDNEVIGPPQHLPPGYGAASRSSAKPTTATPQGTGAASRSSEVHEPHAPGESSTVVTRERNEPPAEPHGYGNAPQAKSKAGQSDTGMLAEPHGYGESARVVANVDEPRGLESSSAAHGDHVQHPGISDRGSVLPMSGPPLPPPSFEPPLETP